MLSKSQLKLITSLRQKKYRVKENLFFAEGVKVVNEFLNSEFKIHKILCTSEFEHQLDDAKIQVISDDELKKISLLKSPNQVLGVFEIPAKKEALKEGLIIALDDINDPGNLGTIIRLCDWFGVKQLVCSNNTVDCFNSKVVQSSMGSLTRLRINYIDLKSYFKTVNLPIYTTQMNGENVYRANLSKGAILVLGNEANGIHKELLEMSTNQLAIPRFGTIQKTESLNVASATAILLSEFKRG